MKKIFSIIIILIMLLSTGCDASAKVKYYTKKGTCPICHEPLAKYCYGGTPYFVWSCPKGCEDE